jgi:hypothetical protein
MKLGIIITALQVISILYEGESLIGHKWIYNVKHMIFEPGRKYLFFDLSSSNFDTLVPSLYQCIENPELFTRSTVASIAISTGRLYGVSSANFERP